MKTGAADNLLGIRLKSGWNVVEKFQPKPNSTGGNFSTCYKVERDGEYAFLKALDFAKIFNRLPPDVDIVKFIKYATSSFEFERDVLLRCQEKRMSKVATLLDTGEEILSNYDFDRVPYLIFDMAETTIRHELEHRIDNAFKLQSLHNICVGINQLHRAQIAHQDIKPSNVLVYENRVSKIADLGRAICHDIDGPHKNLIVPGDPEYAPPELHYRYYHPDLQVRIYCTDLYLLGSLISFYFTGYSMNAFLKAHLHPKFQPGNWGGTFHELLPYLEAAFLEAVNTIAKQITPNELSLEITPNIENRGAKSLNNSISNKYSAYKYVARLNMLYRKAYFELFKN